MKSILHYPRYMSLIYTVIAISVVGLYATVLIPKLSSLVHTTRGRVPPLAKWMILEEGPFVRQFPH